MQDTADSIPQSEPCPVYFHNDGRGTWRPFADEQNRKIEFGWRQRSARVPLHFPHNPAGNKDFEVRFGSAAISKKMSSPPKTGIVQVNVLSENTRVVRRGDPAPQAEQEEPGAVKVPTAEKVIRATHQCGKACDELVATEERYVKVLEVLAHTFLAPLRAWAAEVEQQQAAGNTAAAAGAVTTQEVDFVFGHVDILLKVNTDLLAEFKEALRESKRNGGGNTGGGLLNNAGAQEGGPAGGFAGGSVGATPTALAQVLLKAAQGPLRMYAPHLRKFSQARDKHAELLRARPRFADAVRVLELQPAVAEACGNPRLPSLLANTMQRLMRYDMMLREIGKHVGVVAELAGRQGGRGSSGGSGGGGGGGGPAYAEEARAAAVVVGQAVQCIAGVTTAVDERIGESEGRTQALLLAKDPLMIHSEVLEDPVAGWRARFLRKEGKPVAKIALGHRGRHSSVFGKLGVGRGKSVDRGGAKARRTPRRGFLFNDILVLFSPSSGNIRQYALHELVVVDIEQAYSPFTGAVRCWHLEPLRRAVAALFPDAPGAGGGLLAAEEWDAAFIVAAGNGTHELVCCPSARERAEWVRDLISAASEQVAQATSAAGSRRNLSAASPSSSDGGGIDEAKGGVAGSDAAGAAGVAAGSVMAAAAAAAAPARASPTRASMRVQVKISSASYRKNAAKPDTAGNGQGGETERNAVLAKLLDLCADCMDNTAGPLEFSAAYDYLGGDTITEAKSAVLADLVGAGFRRPGQQP